MFQISEVARRLGVNPQTIYFYERKGLIPSPRRTEAGYRLFSEEDVGRLAFILRVKSLGLTLEEIREILELKDGRSLTCQAVYDRLHEKLTEIREKIDQLQAFHDELSPLVQRCQDQIDSPRECVVLDEWKSDPP
ncbi:heavy metal-responsive transcriptional regulator [Lyngbya sp. CCY1209]|uniref:heavy metal-responsive transcriptional regulator n=1 Tax=Lyngbya sp. CCY1209 TaxID=2886103 RepID=UPI002D2170E2|nr:heavy metal-responsive transcriptional regulator [Lyngbya sp. CCY1209]MEB3883675.1 heavy metal-responsive transcriptional regulator [Lyngbya sp. CCY1209]